MSAVIAAVAGLLAAGITVEGTTTCPTAAEVESRLGPLVQGGAGPDGDSQSVRLHREGQALHISLVRADGHLLAWRSVDGSHGCDALAEAAAVIVAAWKSDVGARPLLAASSGTAPSLGASTASQGALERAAPGPAWGLAVAGGVTVAGTAAAPAAVMSFAHAPVPASAWAVRGAVVYQGEREAGLPGGKLRWQRWVLELGPQVQGAVGALGWELHLALAGGLTRLSGRGLVDPRAHSDSGLGVATGARLVLGRTGARPFLDLGLRAWPTRIVAYAGGSTVAETAIARLEAALMLGVAVGR